jgi:hypothetical protein
MPILPIIKDAYWCKIRFNSSTESGSVTTTPMIATLYSLIKLPFQFFWRNNENVKTIKKASIPGKKKERRFRKIKQKVLILDGLPSQKNSIYLERDNFNVRKKPKIQK